MSKIEDTTINVKLKETYLWWNKQEHSCKHNSPYQFVSQGTHKSSPNMYPDAHPIRYKIFLKELVQNVIPLMHLITVNMVILKTFSKYLQTSG